MGITAALNMMLDDGVDAGCIGPIYIECGPLGRVGHAVVRWSIAAGQASPMLLALALGAEAPSAEDFDMVTQLFASHTDRGIADATCRFLNRVRFGVS